MAKPHRLLAGRPRQFSEVSLAGIRQLDRESIVPLYFQLAAALLEKLNASDWPAGTRFATERELEEAFDVSRSVVRRALSFLVGDGAIVRVKGSGAFVAPPRHEIPAFGLARALLDPPGGVSLKVLTAREDSLDAAVAHFLQIDGKSTPIAHVTAVAQIKGQPIGLVDSHFPANLMPSLLTSARALQAGAKPHVPGGGVELGHTSVMVEHTCFGGWGGPKVGASEGDPALMARLVQFGSGKGTTRERPLEFARLVYRSDCIQLTFGLD